MNRVEWTAAAEAERMTPLTSAYSFTPGKLVIGATQFWCGSQPVGADLVIPVLGAAQRDSIGRMSAAELIGVCQGTEPTG